MGYFNRCKRFDKDVGAGGAYLAKQVLKKRKRQAGVAAPYDVQLGKTVSVRARFIEDFIMREFKRKRVAFFPAEGAEAASVYTNVRVVDMAVYDVVGRISVKPCPDLMSERTYGVHVGAGKKSLTVRDREPPPLGDLVRDAFQAEFLKVP
jgi:hypothetical protein